MTAPIPPAAPTRNRRGRRGLLAALVLAAAGAVAWWYFRPREPEPQPPAVDLSQAEPEVARAVTAALDEVRAKSRDAAAWGRLGMVLRAHDFEVDSASAFRTAGGLDPKDYRWPYLEGLTLVLFDPPAGLDRLRRAVELAPPDRPEPRLRLAEVLLERGDWAGVAQLASAVPRESPQGMRAQLLLARADAGRGDWAAVLERAAGCATEPHARKAALLLRGEAFAARGEQDRADAEFRQAAALPDPPGWPDPVVTEVLALQVGTVARLAEARRLLDQGDAGEAIVRLEAAARESPNSPGPALLLGQTLVRVGDSDGARRVLEGYAVRFPNSVEGWFNLGVARFQTGDPAAAASAFRKATELKPDHALAHFNLGHCHRKLGDRAAARAAFAEALRCRPDHQPSRQALADLDAGK